MAKLKQYEPGVYGFRCPGCQTIHQYWTPEAKRPHAWNFNGNMDEPTFSPSLMNTWGKRVDPNFEEPEDPPHPGGWSGCCHLFVTKGQIQYCGDCTHELAGQTVPMIDMD